MAIEQSPAPFNGSNQVTLKGRALPSAASAGGWGRAALPSPEPLISTGTRGSTPLTGEGNLSPWAASIKALLFCILFVLLLNFLGMQE